ncbi:hypothetical protein V8D89_000861 [Ganoderma adspersum]
MFYSKLQTSNSSERGRLALITPVLPFVSSDVITAEYTRSWSVLERTHSLTVDTSPVFLMYKRYKFRGRDEVSIGICYTPPHPHISPLLRSERITRITASPSQRHINAPSWVPSYLPLAAALMPLSLPSRASLRRLSPPLYPFLSQSGISSSVSSAAGAAEVAAPGDVDTLLPEGVGEGGEGGERVRHTDLHVTSTGKRCSWRRTLDVEV